MIARVLSYIRRQELMQAGDRVGLAVSGGADSVALLRLMLELRAELGAVLSVVHFNHKIRGTDAEADERFVAELAAGHGLEFHRGSADTPACARERGLSLEAAGRELRYGYFRRLLESGTLTAIATAHTMDDQAETVLLRMMRGAGTRGLAGIFPRVGSRETKDLIVRPLLPIRRSELRGYLQRLSQPWREDASNLDVKHTRNRLRRQLLPLIEREFNPSVVPVLAELAEIAQAEEDYWEAAAGKLLPRTPDSGLDTQLLRRLPLALQRRLIRDFAEESGVRLDFQHVERILDVAGHLQPLETKYVELPEHVLTCTSRELTCQRRSQLQKGPGGYEYRLPVPGEVCVAELGRLLRVSLVPAGEAASGYNRNQLLDLHRLAPELVVRNWHPGDRFWPAHTKSPKKLKELLLRRRIMQPQRAFWPVVVSGETVAWVPGLGAATQFLAGPGTTELAVIEEVNADR